MAYFLRLVLAAVVICGCSQTISAQTGSSGDTISVSLCDTLFNENNDADTPVLYTAGLSADSGYVSGNNVFGDLAKAEAFGALVGDTVEWADVYFAYITIDSVDSDRLLEICIWNDTIVDSVGLFAIPGRVIDTAFVSLRQIAGAVTAANTAHQPVPVHVTFSGHTILNKDTFYVGVILPNTTTDTVALFTNLAANGADENGWELNSRQYYGGGWNTYANDWELPIGNYIKVGLCGSAPLARFNSTSANGCVPLSISFTDSSTNGVNSYFWNFGDGDTSSLANPAHTFLTSGNYNVTETVFNTSGSSLFSELIHVYPLPSATAYPLAPGFDTLVVTVGTPPYIFHWSNGSGNDSIIDAQPGNYTVTITDAHHCTATDTVTIYVGTSIIDLGSRGLINLYPNPLTDEVNLVWSKPANAVVSVFDINGNLLIEKVVENSVKERIGTSKLAAGNYLVKITDRLTGTSSSARIVKLE